MWLGFKTSEVSGANQITPDLSGNSNVGQLFTGKALDFNGSTDSVNINGFQLAGSDATFAFWINPSQAQNKYILDVSPTRFIIAFEGLELSIYSGDFFKFGVIAYSEWSRVAIVVNGTSASCYVNGDQLGTTKTIPAISIGSATSAKISTAFTGSGANYDGKLSDFQIYNEVWSASDIAYDYSKPNHLVTDNPSTSLTVSNLKAYWALTEGAGSIAYDSSGGGINGTISGATYTEHETRTPQLGMVDYSISTPVSDEITLVANPSNPSQDIRGTSVRLREHSFNLDGSGYAEIVDDSSLNISNGTLQFWLKTSDTKFNILTGQSSSEFIGQTDNGAWSFGNAGTITAYKDGSTVSTTPSYDGAWHFYTFTGINISTWTTHYIINLTSFGLDGLIDEVLIYDNVLSATQIDNNYNVSESAHKAGSSFSDDFSGDYGN
tara:strand:- start:4069 stop:5376 length:1308 start_codon:yes stop_codon:yes gene_type:complete